MIRLLAGLSLLAAGARPVPELLVGHLRIADIACLEATARLPALGGSTPDGSPRWAASQLDRAAASLSQATLTTVDPAEQQRLAGLAAEASTLGRSLGIRSDGAALRVARLRFEIRRFAGEVQRRIDLRQPDPVPLVRPSPRP